MADRVLPAATGKAGGTGGKAKSPVNTGWSRKPLPIDTDQRLCSSRLLAEQGRGADCFQRPLVPRSRFQQQLTPSVRPQNIFARLEKRKEGGGQERRPRWLES